MVRRSRRGGDIVCKEDEEMNADGTACVPKTEKTDEDSASDSGVAPEGGRRRHRRHTLRAKKGTRFKAKTLKRILRSAGLKTSGKKSTLRARAKKAHLIRGGGVADTAATV
jgi:hypothetical protein